MLEPGGISHWWDESCCSAYWLVNALPTPRSYLLQSSCFGPELQVAAPADWWPEAPVSHFLPLLHKVHGCPSVSGNLALCHAL